MASITCRLLTTTLTPSIWEASSAAAIRSASLPAAPERVTMPLLAFTWTCFVCILRSALILLCASPVSSASLRPREQLAVPSTSRNSAQKNPDPAQRIFTISASPPTQRVGKLDAGGPDGEPQLNLVHPSCLREQFFSRPHLSLSEMRTVARSGGFCRNLGARMIY